MAKPSALTTAVNMIAAPREALQALKLRPTVLAPLLAIIVANAVLLLTYYNLVDLIWLVETSLQNAPQDLTEEQREAATNAMENLSPMVLGSIAAISAIVFLTLWFFLNAAYLAGVSLLTGDDFRLKNWFSMICWCSLPLVFGYGASMVNLLVSDATFLRADRMNPLSFASLLELDSAGASTLRQSLQSIDITAIWSMALGVFAYHVWTRRSVLKSVAIVLAPPILIFGTIFYFTSN